ncbi:hypothetical protein AAEH72_16040 [Shewanella xiamenensis]|uniref:hypothetical protein n=1 Tax=Shewanella TaxID=22 RepID=UPI0021BE0F80|nr:hypothetical protein [Shewanella xiamenensis]MCT8877511.1 hypothetical protein [Shewanella xiamenensis]
MSINHNSDEEFGKELSVYGKDKPNRDFCQQMADALVELGTKETLSCMARFMAAIATNQGVALEFNCDLGKVTIEPKELPPRH